MVHHQSKDQARSECFKQELEMHVNEAVKSYDGPKQYLLAMFSTTELRQNFCNWLYETFPMMDWKMEQNLILARQQKTRTGRMWKGGLSETSTVLSFN